MKLELLTNATVVDDAIRFVSVRSKEKQQPSSSNMNEDGKEDSNEPDYDDEKSDKDKQEVEASKITTINKVF